MALDISDFIEESLAQGRGWQSEEEREAYLASLDEQKFAIFAEDASEMNPEDIDAFNSLIYDNRTPAELVDHFRTQGNRHFASGKRNKMFFRHALVSYGKALTEARSLPPDYAASEDGRAEVSKLWSNCAAANLGLRNWGSAVKAADAALELWEANVKAAYRKTRALMELKRYQEAAVAAAQGLALDAENQDLAKLARVAQKKFVEARRQDEAKAAAVLKRQQPVLDLWELAQTSGAKLAAPDKGLAEAAGNHALASARPRWHEEAGQRCVQWPLLLLYPEYSQSDFVAEAMAPDMLAEWLGRVLPEEEHALPEWDERREYRGSNVDVYFKTNAALPVASEEDMLQAWGVAESRVRPAGEASEEEANTRAPSAPEEGAQAWVPVHPGCTLAQIVGHPEHVLVGGVVTLTVVPRRTAAQERFQADAREFTRGIEAMLQPGA